jgi:hypothetical protein
MKLLNLDRGLGTGLLAAVLYSVISVLIYGSKQSWLTNFIGVGADPMSYIWGLNWWPWAIGHGIYPMVSHYVWYPTGFHMAWADAVPGAALIGLPLILAGNAVLACNVLMLVAPAASALGAFLLIRYLTRDTVASLFGGYLFGFSTYQIAHGTGHLSLVLTFLVPVIALLVLKRIAGELSRRCFIGSLTICLLIQFTISMEIFATVCVFGAMAWLVGLIFASAEHRKHLFVVALEILLGAAIVVLLILPWLVSLYRGRPDVPVIINEPGLFGTDLLNFITPTKLTWLRSIAAEIISTRFSDNIVENSGYVGLPLIILLILRFRESWRTVAGRILLCLVLLFASLSIGTSLLIGGRHFAIWTPWRMFLGLPLIRYALPGRFSMYVALTAAVAAGYWFAAARSPLGRVGRLALGCVAIIMLFPNLQMVRWSQIPSLPFFERANLERALGSKPNLVILPFLESAGEPGPSMIWQWQSGMAFTQSGGYLGNVPPDESNWAAVDSFNRGRPGPDFGNDVKMYAAAHRVDAIVAGPRTQTPLLEALEKLGWKEEQTGGVRVYNVPDLSGFPYYSVSGQYWPGTEVNDWSWMGRGITISASAADYTVDLRGTWRPPALGPATVVITQDGHSTTSTVETKDGLQIPLAAGHSLTLQSRSIFSPNDFAANGDRREMSVMLRITRR